MNKELTPLQALKELKKRYGKKFSFNDDERCHIIETALKKLENYERNEDFNKDVLNYALLSEKDKIDKIKAFEILKRTGLDIEWFRNNFIKIDNDFEFYDEVRIRLSRANEEQGKRYTLAPSEFELLIEVLK